jgi:hypothetical protein
MMKKWIVLFLLAIAGLLATHGYGFDPQWSGVWRLEQGFAEGDAVVFHLVVSADPAVPRLDLYTNTWTPLRAYGPVLKDADLTFNWESSGTPFRMSLSTSAQTVSGTWQMSHPQYRMEGKVAGRKVLSDPGWNPFNGLREVQSAEGLIDFAFHLIEKSAGKSYADFADVWRKEMEPAFYPVLDRLLYGSGKAKEGLRQRFLESAFRYSQDRDFKSASEKFAALYPVVYGDLKRTFPELDLKAAVITLPPFQDAPQGVFRLADLAFTACDLLEFGRLSEVESRFYLARKIIGGSILVRYPAEDFYVHLFREGVQAYMVSRLKYSDRESDWFSIKEDDLRETRKNLNVHLAEILEKLRTRNDLALNDLQQSRGRPVSVIGFDFMGKLLAKQPLVEIAGLERQQIRKEVLSYLSSGQ